MKKEEKQKKKVVKEVKDAKVEAQEYYEAESWQVLRLGD
jgi:hypothetical protein